MASASTQQSFVQRPDLYSAPHPLTKLIRIVHILVSWYTASKPWFTDWAKRAANSWLLKIFKLHPVKKRTWQKQGISLTRLRNPFLWGWKETQCHFPISSGHEILYTDCLNTALQKKESMLPRFHSSYAEKEENGVTGQRTMNASAHTADCHLRDQTWDPHVGPPSISFTITSPIL